VEVAGFLRANSSRVFGSLFLGRFISCVVRAYSVLAKVWAPAITTAPDLQSRRGDTHDTSRPLCFNLAGIPSEQDLRACKITIDGW